MLSIGIIEGVGKPDDRPVNPLDLMRAGRKVQTAKRGGIAATRYPATLDMSNKGGTGVSITKVHRERFLN